MNKFASLDRIGKMDTTTLILFVSTFAAFCWWFAIQLNENKTKIREFERNEQDRISRAELVRQLTKKL